MKKLSALRFLFLLGAFLFLPQFNPVFASHKVFQDNFDDGNLNKWKVAYNTCSYDGSPAKWEVVDGRLGIKINGGSCITDLIPKDEFWNTTNDNYIVEFDMTPVSGTDHNFAFRYTELVGWYGIHIQAPNTLVLQGVLNTDKYQSTVFSNFPYGDTIHFKIEVEGEHIKIYKGSPPSLILDYPDAGGRMPKGKIDIQASAGADPNSETWFDNIVVTSIDNPSDILDVPYFSQNALPWGPTEYDHATLLKAPDPTMDRWGCVVTSAAMVLNYHGMKEFANGTPINPGSLNLWLKDHNGYLYGEGTEGWYSYFNWPIIETLTKGLFDTGKSTLKLIHRRAYPSSATTDLINKDITVDKFPDILGVKNASTSSHFVVAKGKLNDGYAINDPEWNVSDLSSFNNIYTQVDRYIPSHTNLSYLIIVVNPNVEVLVADSKGNKTGKSIHNGQTEVLNQIPNATYSFQDPIEDPDNNGNKEKLGTGVNEFLLPEPLKGKYTITLSSKTNTFYTINISTFQKDGINNLYKKGGVLGSNQDDIFNLEYSQEQNSISERIINFQNLIDDIKEAQSLKLINKNAANPLLMVAKSAKNNYEKGLRKISLLELNVFQKLLNTLHGVPRVNLVDEKAYQILLYDVNYLKTHI